MKRTFSTTANKGETISSQLLCNSNLKLDFLKTNNGTVTSTVHWGQGKKKVIAKGVLYISTSHMLNIKKKYTRLELYFVIIISALYGVCMFFSDTPSVTYLPLVEHHYHQSLCWYQRVDESFLFFSSCSWTFNKTNVSLKQPVCFQSLIFAIRLLHLCFVFCYIYTVDNM